MDGFKIVLIASVLMGLMLNLTVGESSEPKATFHLKCLLDSNDCTLYETLPRIDIEYEPEVELKELSYEDEKDSAKRNAHPDPTNIKFQNLIKRFFLKQSNEPAKVYKTNEINCLTGDCRVLTAKINKRTKNGTGTLACVGDPYSNSGSRCVPIEGLYIGRK